jgi:excinuclease ABC subunit C
VGRPPDPRRTARIFPYLTCDREITGQDSPRLPVLRYQTVPGPCIGAVDQAQYRQMIDDLCAFLEGRTEHILRPPAPRDGAPAEELQFERAAAKRDQLTPSTRSSKRQKVVLARLHRLGRDRHGPRERDACVQMFFIRGGKLIGREYFLMEGAKPRQDDEVL